MKSRLLATTVITAALIIGTPLAASAETQYVGTSIPGVATAGATITYSSAPTGQPVGAAVTVTLTGIGAANANIALASSISHTFAIGSNGRIALKIALPTTAAAGEKYSLVVSSGSFIETRSISIVAAPADVAGAALAATGSETAPLVWFGGGLLALGIAFAAVMTMMRRNRLALL